MINFVELKKNIGNKLGCIFADKKLAAIVVLGCISVGSLVSTAYCYYSIRNSRLGYINVYTVSNAPRIKAVEEENDKAMKELAKEIYAKTSGIPDNSLEEVRKLKNEFDKRASELRTRKIAEKNKLLREASDKVRAEKGLSAVLGVNVILSGGVDVTNDVIQKLQ